MPAFSPAIAGAVAMIFVGCCTNVIFLELIISQDRGAGNLITCAQFTFIVVEGIRKQIVWPLALKPRTIPLWFYVATTSLFFSLSVVNNKALDFDISMPMHMVFRSASLLGSVLVGFCAFGKRYRPAQVVAVVLVTCGTVVTLLADAREKQRAKTAQKGGGGCCGGDGAPLASGGVCGAAPGGGDAGVCGDGGDSNADATPGDDDESVLFWWVVGIAMLLGALILSSFLGHVQQWSYTKWGGKNAASDTESDAEREKRERTLKALPREGMFYCHLISLPFFGLLAADLRKHAALFNASAPLAELLGGPVAIPTGSGAALGAWLGGVPVLWLYLLGNVCTQFVCIRGVYTLTGLSDAVTTSFALTVRKFVSLVFSVLYFRNPFSAGHWGGAAGVFVGAALYTGVLNIDPVLRALGIEASAPVAAGGKKATAGSKAKKE